MNYRHAFHAGNFADVVKHALLVALVTYLKTKDKPFRVIDTHAGIARYDLASSEALRTGEHRDGIAALLASPAATAPELADYVAAATADGPDAYPGSPLIVRRLLRPGDRLAACELHPDDARTLAAVFAGDRQVKTLQLDGWLALGAHLPPKERRGLVLIDPPYEQPGEVERILAGLKAAHRRWPGGIYALWYPIKRRAEHERLHRGLVDSGIPDILACDFLREPFAWEERLVGSGLVVVNPPYTFATSAQRIMDALAPALGIGGQGRGQVIALVPERP